MFRLELVQVRLTRPRLNTWLPWYMHCLLIWSSLARCGTPVPSLVRYELSVKGDMCWYDKMAEPARCDTPVPYPLSVMNSVKAKKVVFI